MRLIKRLFRPRAILPSIEFCIDDISDQIISGWAWHPGRPDDRAQLELVLADDIIGTFVADRYRLDLELAGKGDGFCAFSCELPPLDRLEGLDGLVIRLKGTTNPLKTINLSMLARASKRLPKPLSNEQIVSGENNLVGAENDGSSGHRGKFKPPATAPKIKMPPDRFGPRWIRFSGSLDLSLAPRAKVRLTVDDAELWCGTVPMLAQDGGLGAVDVSLSFPEPDRPTLKRKVRVDSAVIGLDPASFEIEVDYSGRFTGSVTSFKVVNGNAEATVRFSDNAELTTDPFVRVMTVEGEVVDAVTRSSIARKGADGIISFELSICFPLGNREAEEFLIFPMWSAVALRNDDVEQDHRLPGRLIDPTIDVENVVTLRLDRVQDGIAGGWAKLADDDVLKLLVDIEVDGRVVNSGVASLYRGDLAKALGTSGCHGFEIEVPRGILPGSVVSAVVRWPRTVASRSLPSEPTGGTQVVATPDAGRALGALLAPPPRIIGATGRVDVIVVNLNGAHLLDEMFTSFRANETYRDVQFIVVDHGSTDESDEVCRRHAAALDIDFLQRNGNFSFSDSNNFGVAHGRSHYVLLLNNDTVFLEAILGAMVERAANPEVAAVGLRLVDVHNDGLDALLAERNDQHLGVFLSGQPGAPMYELRCSPYSQSIAREAIVAPGVTAAAMMLRREVFEAVGGFDTAFFYGQEDVDLCFRLSQAHGVIVCENGLVLGHKRGFSRSRANGQFRETQKRNRQLIHERHGRAVRRLLRGPLAEQPRWTAQPPVIAFLVTDISSNTTAGDPFTARELAEELARHFDAEIRLVMPVDGWFDLVGVDLVISMRDDFSPFRMRGLPRHGRLVYWVRNWFDRFRDSGHWQYADEIWCSSRFEAAQFEDATGRPARVLPIATNAERFRAGRFDPDYACDYCFTGSWWGAHREILVNADPWSTEYTFKIFGAGWGKSRLKDFWYGAVPYSEMPSIYASTRLVVDDANHVTELTGSVNSRVFDALAAGALPVTNGRLGSEEIFEGRLPVYRSAQELTALIERYLGDAEARDQLVAELRAEVLAHHTYARRAEAVSGFLRNPEPGPSIAIKIGAPSKAVRDDWGDYHFAEALRREFARLGLRAAIFYLHEWESEAAARCDVVLTLRGLSAARLDPDQLNLMWLISHPDKTTVDELRGYDHVFVASERHAARLREDGVAASVLLQCSDIGRFALDLEPLTDAPEVLFVGNSRGGARRIVSDAVSAGLAVHIYGKGWAGLVPDSYVRGEYIPNSELARWYASAGVVLNDHWPDMARNGFLSNRLFDAVSCGAFVISDRADGLESVFGDLVAPYDTPDDLVRLVGEGLGRSKAANAARRRSIEAFRDRHSFAQRAKALSEIIEAAFAPQTREPQGRSR